MFGDRPPFHHPPLQTAGQPVAPAGARRPVRRIQAIILLITLAIAFALSSAFFLLQSGGEPRETPAAAVREEEPPSGREESSEEPETAYNRRESFVGDGSTYAFRLAETPAAPDGEIAIKVLVNGQSTEASVENRTVTFESPPADGDEILISYLVAEEPEPSPVALPEPAEPEAPVLVIQEIPAVPAHPEPPDIDISRPPEPPEEPEPPVAPGEDVDRLYPGVDQEIKDLANQLGLTDSAKRILYDHDPKIFEDPGDPGYICGAGRPDTIIYGCWSVEGERRAIHLLRSPSIQTTLAHELLHAIYYDSVRRGESDGLHELLDEVRRARPAEIAEFLAFYQHHYTEDPEWNSFLEYSEMHSFIGSQFRGIPAGLEDHYGAHFKDRSQVVAFYETWSSSARAKNEENNRIQEIYDRQLAQWQACLDDGLGSRTCGQYRPEGQDYQDYNACLISYKTLMSECLEIKPAEVDYQPE